MFGLRPQNNLLQFNTVHAEGSMLRRSPSSHIPASNWLPCVSSRLLTKPMTKNYIKQNKHNDLILSIAWAMIEQGNAVDAQGRMLAKLYLTLRDHEELSRGLAGKYAHIRGGDVMQHLLSHVGEFSSTKHKFTKDADTVLDELEDWMEGGRTWSEALQAAKAKAEELSKERRFASTRAPMLFSPAGMLALVVIAYPDSKYTERIGRLQLSWMLDQPREELDVQDGFWKGLNKTNLERAFVREDVRESGEELLVDYDLLFGDQFLQLGQDIRPCLKSWIPDITVVGLETELFEQQSIDSDGGTPAPTPAPALLNHDTCSALQKYLQSPCTKIQAELHGWLANKLSGESQIIGGWVKYWVYRIDKAAHYEEQLIVQSLFQQSLNVLYRLYNATDVSETMADVYMLSDMDEEEVSHDQSDIASTDLRDLYSMPSFMEYANANTQLLQCLGHHTRPAQLLKHLSGHMATYFNNVVQSEKFSKYADKIMLFAKHRTQILIKAFDLTRNQGHSQSSSISSPSPLGGDEGRLLTEEVIGILKLTRWQLRQLVVPRGDLRTVLTEWQLRAYGKMYDEGSREPDLSIMETATPFSIQDTTGVVSNTSHRTSLLKLLGDITEPYAERLKVTRSISFSPSPESMLVIPAAKSIAPTTIRDTAVSTQVLSASSNHGTPSAQILSHSIPAPRNSSSDTPSRTTVSLANSPERDMRDSSVYSSPSKKRPFAGLAWKPSKRSHASDRPAEAPRLGDMTTDEFSQEIKTSTQHLRKEITDKIMDTTEELISQFSARHEALKDMQAKDAATLSACVSHATVALKDCITVVVESLRKEMLVMGKTVEQTLQISEAAKEQTLASCSHFDTSSQNLQNSVRNAVQEESKKMYIVLDANLRSIKDDILQEIGLLRAQQENVPALGDDGYLIVHCTAPPNWDSKAYEAKLIGAAYFYIELLGHPPDGFGADEETLDKTSERFADLSPEHIVLALEQVHMRRYGFPLKMRP